LSWLARVTAGGLLAGSLLVQVHAQQGIYTCVDAKGRRLTADRPIAECVDREQSELSAGGMVKRKIGPSLTADERAAEEEKARQLQQERNRVADEKRRNRALLTRYPEREVHDRSRAADLAQLDELIATADRRQADLARERQRLDTELEFFGNDMAKAPPQLKRQFDENTQNIEAQKRYIANQEAEKRRLNARYDQELVRLQKLWAAAASASAPATAAARR